MALIEPYMEKNVTLSATQQCVLTAKVGQSIRILDVRVYNAANRYVQMLTDKVAVGFFRVSGNPGNQLPFSQKSLLTDTGAITSATGLTNCNETMIGYMRRMGWMDGYPVAEGQSFSVAEYGTSTPTAKVQIIYEIHAAGDMKADMANGSESKEYVYMSYGKPAAVLAVDTSTIMAVASNPAEYIGFPWTDTVPANKTIEVLAVCGSPTSVTGDSSNQGVRTTALKLVKDRTVLCDDDRTGLSYLAKTPAGSADAIQIGEGYSAIGNLSTSDRREPFTGISGMAFAAGEDLDVYVSTEHIGTTAGTPKTIAILDSEIGLVLRVASGNA